MEGFQGLSREWMEQIALLSSIIGGFSLAIAVELLASDKKQRIVPVLISVFIMTASLLLVSTSLGSQVVIKMAIVENTPLEDVPPHLQENMPTVAQAAAAIYYVGLSLFIFGLGLAGWMHSKTVGLITSIMAVVSGITIAVLIFMIM